VRVVSLLPAATEMVAALGGTAHLVGISHECDYPPGVQRLPRVTATPVNAEAPSAVIDAEVHRLKELGRPVIAVDAEQLRRLEPNLILSQELCEVCAVSDGQVHRVTQSMPQTRVLSLAARNLEGIWSDIRAVGGALDLDKEAQELVLDLRSRLNRLRHSRPAVPPRVACVEWLDPPYAAGHWVPELVDWAGGFDVGSRPGAHSTQRKWSELRSLEPERVIVMLCGFGLARARRELELLDDPIALELMSEVPTYVIDGNQYTSRPGPRVVDGALLIHSAIVGQPNPEVERWYPPVPSSHS
jgi:iron complex transport system substrate-binding protein